MQKKKLKEFDMNYSKKAVGGIFILGLLILGVGYFFLLPTKKKESIIPSVTYSYPEDCDSDLLKVEKEKEKEKQVTPSQYEMIKNWVRSQPELKTFVLTKLKDDGILTDSDIGDIAGEAIRLRHLKDKRIDNAYREEFKNSMSN